jgi:hypothetical protein
VIEALAALFAVVNPEHRTPVITQVTITPVSAGLPNSGPAPICPAFKVATSFLTIKKEQRRWIRHFVM